MNEVSLVSALVDFLPTIVLLGATYWCVSRPPACAMMALALPCHGKPPAALLPCPCLGKSLAAPLPCPCHDQPPAAPLLNPCASHCWAHARLMPAVLIEE